MSRANFPFKPIVSICAVTAMAVAASAQAAVVFSGTDAFGTANSDAARVDFEASLSSFTVDDLTGLAGTNLSLGSDAGSSFNAAGASFFGVTNFNDGVISGTGLSISNVNFETEFTWVLPDVHVDSLGFSTGDQNGSDITISIGYDDFTADSFIFSATSGFPDNSFWGISGLTKKVIGVTLTSTGLSGTEFWDDFTFGSTVGGADPVPVPPAAILMAAGLGIVGMRRRRS